MDHYQVLEVSQEATREEIKEAFRRSATKYHPDKHTQSSASVREDATLRFKQASEAYEILANDLSRARYNHELSASSSLNNGGNVYNYDDSHRSHYRKASRSSSRVDGLASKFRPLFLFLSSRAVLLNAVFAGAMLGGLIFTNASRDSLWRRHNSGKSFEEAMDSIKKANSQKQ